MALQYIGARYVPRFMGAYDNTQVYEALDVVDNGLGTSYIAKIPTPAGTPLTNTTYWALYGASSGAIVNLQNQIDAHTLDISELQDLARVSTRLKGKKIMIFGDSISDQDWSGSGADPTGKVPVWTDYFIQALDGVATVTNNSEVGRKMVQLPDILDTYASIDADIVIVQLGTNDFNAGVQMGNYSSNSTYFAGAVGQVFTKIGNLTGKNAEIWFITPLTRYFNFGMNSVNLTLECYRQCIIGFMKHYGGCWINGNDMPRLSNFFGTLYDTIHPKTEYAPTLCEYILSCLNSYNGNHEVNDVAYYGDVSSLLDSTYFTNTSKLHYHMEGQKFVFEGFLVPVNNELSVGDAINTTGLGDILQLASPDRYQPAALFTTNTGDSAQAAFIFETGGKLYWRLNKAIATNCQQLSFRYEFLPSWCNVYTDGMV